MFSAMKADLRPVLFRNLGHMDYRKAWSLQESLCADLVQQKLARRKSKEAGEKPSHHLLFCSHPSVITLGRNADPSHVLLQASALARKGIALVRTNRGGDVTYHGPSQLVMYLIFDLDAFYHDIHLLLRDLEQVVIDLMHHYGLQGERMKGFTGVWAKEGGGRMVKIAAMGLRCTHWVSMHGVSLNISQEEASFRYIIPCGISSASQGVGSLESLLGHGVDRQEVEAVMLGSMSRVFHLRPFSAFPPNFASNGE